MNANHTQGEWKLETVKTSCGICHRIGPFPGSRPEDKPRHACLYSDYDSPSNPADAELLANAKLIAAAPKLLDIAKQALALHPSWEAAREVISDATE